MKTTSTPMAERLHLSACTLRGHAPAGGVRVIHSDARSELAVPPLFTHTSELIVAGTLI